ncbi:MAG: 3'(2'),5'-bisphosphate nucleotidase CysQ [Cytophagales bacterium]|nr:3'(2'),5'-bisphosphate nucleotidase CysQ [Cytophagales bacterium]
MIDHKRKELLALAREAGRAVLDIYQNPEAFGHVEHKADDSPLTLADKASHRVISEGLAALFPDVPVLSEEGADVPYELRSQWKAYFLVDPLDGTKEFISRNGEFTVNIAYVAGNQVESGIIYAPVQDVLYFGKKGEGAFKQTGGQPLQRIRVNASEKRIAVRSKSHASTEEQEVLRRYGIKEEISVGSSLKFCMVAEGKADIYYRHGPTMEWDTAAGQAIVEAAGGKVFKGDQERVRFSYNKENLLNGSFLVLS